MEVGVVVSLIVGPVIVLLVPTLVWSESIVKLGKSLQARIRRRVKTIAAQVAPSTR